MNETLDRLRREGESLLILNNGKTLFTSSDGCMRPLFEAINHLELQSLRKSLVVDKIVGKAAEILISYFQAKEVHCIVLSHGAEMFMEKRGITLFSEHVIPMIKNRLETDICPFEKAILKVEDPKEGYVVLSKQLYSLSSR